MEAFHVRLKRGIKYEKERRGTEFEISEGQFFLYFFIFSRKRDQWLTEDNWQKDFKCYIRWNKLREKQRENKSATKIILQNCKRLKEIFKNLRSVTFDWNVVKWNEKEDTAEKDFENATRNYIWYSARDSREIRFKIQNGTRVSPADWNF